MLSAHQTRRDFIGTAAAAIGSAAALPVQTATGGGVPRRPFGKTGVQVSALGVGGFHLGAAQDLNEARAIVDTALDAGVAVLGMKSMGGSGEMVRHGAVTAAQALRYAMSLPVTVTISGMDSLGVLKQNLEIARGFQPMSAADMQRLRDRCQLDAADGRWELFKTTKKYDGDLGRAQHGFPSAAELPA